MIMIREMPDGRAMIVSSVSDFCDAMGYCEVKIKHFLKGIEPPTVVRLIREIFGSGEYRKVLLVWEVEDKSVIEQAKKIYGIEIWKMSSVLNKLIREVGTKAFRDDVLRTIQLISMR